ncbi:MAG: DNA repair protein RecN [Thermoanaerobaculia bacterium]
MILKEVYIKNLATIKEIKFELSKSLNLITGETGAGKSILVDALKILSGKKVDPEIIRFGENQLVVEGIFQELGKEVLEFLKERDLEGEVDFLIIRREIYKDRPQKIFINNNPVSLKTLEQLGAQIISIFGQEEERSFEEEFVCLKFLDLFAGIDTTELSFFYNSIKDKEKLLKEMEEKKKESERMREFLSFSISEIEKANLKEGEIEELQNLKFQLKKKEEILRALNFFLQKIEGEENSTIKVLKEGEKLFEPLKEKLPFCNEIINHLSRAAEEIGDAFSIATREMVSFQEPELSLDFIESRLALIEGLQKKYGKTIEEILNYQKKAKEELSNLSNLDSEIEKIKQEKERQEEKYEEISRKISLTRIKNAEIFKDKINKILPKLNLKNALFEVEVIYDERNFTPYGRDTVIFKIQTNIGEKMLPIGKIASGGELSRIHLAIQEVIQAKKGKVMVFDEVDQGIGGKTAFYVGKMLKSISQRDQVLCVSHLPQVAVWAENHMKAYKFVEGNRTYTTLENLSGKERLKEIARMLGGEEFESALEHAKKLIESTGGKI